MDSVPSRSHILPKLVIWKAVGVWSMDGYVNKLAREREGITVVEASPPRNHVSLFVT